MQNKQPIASRTFNMVLCESARYAVARENWHASQSRIMFFCQKLCCSKRPLRLCMIILCVLLLNGAILILWQGLILTRYSPNGVVWAIMRRARNLHASAQYISQSLDGNIPETVEELKKLKGIGDYSASAIAAIAFNKPRYCD